MSVHISHFAELIRKREEGKGELRRAGGLKTMNSYSCSELICRCRFSMSSSLSVKWV